MKHARSINSRSRFLVRFQKFHSKPIFHQSYTLSANFPISPASRIAHFSVVSVTNTPTPRFLVVSANTHTPVTSPPPPTVRPPRNKKGGPQVHARRPPCYPIIKPMGIEHNQINPSPSYFLTEMANPPLLAHLICNLVSQFTFWFSIT